MHDYICMWSTNFGDFFFFFFTLLSIVFVMLQHILASSSLEKLDKMFCFCNEDEHRIGMRSSYLEEHMWKIDICNRPYRGRIIWIDVCKKKAFVVIYLYIDPICVHNMCPGLRHQFSEIVDMAIKEMRKRSKLMTSDQWGA